jgi:hypothetical protein
MTKAEKKLKEVNPVISLKKEMTPQEKALAEKEALRKLAKADLIAEAIKGMTGIEATCTADAIKYLLSWKQIGVEGLKKVLWNVNYLIKQNETV